MKDNVEMHEAKAQAYGFMIALCATIAAIAALDKLRELVSGMFT